MAIRPKALAGMNWKPDAAAIGALPEPPALIPGRTGPAAAIPGQVSDATPDPPAVLQPTAPFEQV